VIHECPAGGEHDPEKEFHYVDVGVGFVPAALTDVRCAKCEEDLMFCSYCAGLYGEHMVLCERAEK